MEHLLSILVINLLLTFAVNQPNIEAFPKEIKKQVENHMQTQPNQADIPSSQLEKVLWSPEYCMQYVRTCSSPDLSNDGRYALYTINNPLYNEGSSEFKNQLLLCNLATHEEKWLSNSNDSCINPRFSPQNKLIAFLSNRSGKMNLWLLPIDGGEAWQLTDVPNKITQFAWSPDGSSIAFTQLGELPVTANGIEVVDQESPIHHLCIVHIPPARSSPQTYNQLTPDTIYPRPEQPIAWSQDGKTIAFAFNRSGTFNDWADTNIGIIDPFSKQLKQPFPLGSVYHSPCFSANGEFLACVKHKKPYQYDFTGTIGLLHLTNNTYQEFDITSLDCEFGLSGKLIGWDQNSSMLYLLQATGTEVGLFALSIDTGQIQRIELPLPFISEVRFNGSGSHLIGILQGCETAPEIYTMDPIQEISEKISNMNSHLPLQTLGKTQKISWTSQDLTAIEGLLTYPQNYQKGIQYPLIVVVHGGPMGVFSQYFTALPTQLYWPIASFSQQQYFILRCNIRGSTGYGTHFRRANFGDWGGKDFEDLMTGIDHLIEQKLVDLQCMGISGWSYGGFMTTWAISQSQRFKAASVGAPVINLISFAGTSDAQAFTKSYFGGNFWENAELYHSHSPIMQAHKITTPTLLQHGMKDYRVPISQSDELYNVLKSQGTPIQYVKYPRTEHSIKEPALLVDCGNRNIAWFNQFLKINE